MHITPWIWLGKGNAIQQKWLEANLGNKAALLNKAVRHKIPVPRSLIIPEETLLACLGRKLILSDEKGIHITNPERVYYYLTLPGFDAPVAIRSSFSMENDDLSNQAGHFFSSLNVDASVPSNVIRALQTVWSSSVRHQGTKRRDVLIMNMIQAKVGGVAFTEQQHEDDRINYAEGSSDRLVGGGVRGEVVEIPKLRKWERTTASHPPFLRRLQKLLRSIRQVFGNGNWDIQWADDGKKCWLLQIRPITQSTRRNEIFAIANHKEILPQLPSRFMTSVIASCAPGLFEYYRAFDAELPSSRSFIEEFKGRPYINLSLLQDMMRIWGLHSGLINAVVGGGSIPKVHFNPLRMLRKLPVLRAVYRSQRSSTSNLTETIQAIHGRTNAQSHTIEEAVEKLQWLYTTMVREVFSFTGALSFPLAVLRRIGALNEHHASHQSVSSKLYADMERLQKLVQSNPELRPALRVGVLPDSAAFSDAWKEYLERHGHRGIFESDIARPRFAEKPETLLKSLAAKSEDQPRPSGRTLRGILTLPLWKRVQKPLHAREELRHHAMHAFSRIRQSLLKQIDRFVEAGILEKPEYFWMLTQEEAIALDNGWLPGAAFFAHRKKEIEQLNTYALPDLLKRFDDLDGFCKSIVAASKQKRLSGISLTNGVLEGKAWVLNEPSSELPDGFKKEETILITRSVDVGWIPTFKCVSGVIVETGGDLSHGSIILREIGIPALTNVHNATRHFKTGDEIILQAESGMVQHYGNPAISG